MTQGGEGDRLAAAPSRRAMLRTAALGGGLAAAGGALALGRAEPVQAQGARSLVGTWVVTFSSTRPFPQAPFSIALMMAVTADGLLLLSGPPRNPGPAQAGDTQDYESNPYGVWQSTGPDSAAYTIVWLAYDGEGVYGGTQKTSGTLQLGADGNSLSGTGRYSVVVGSTTLTYPQATVQGTRVQVETA